MASSRATSAFTADGVAYALSSSDELDLALCDGTLGWTGKLNSTDLTPPKRGLAGNEFRRRLLQGLRGCGSADVLSVQPVAASSDVELLWTAITEDATLGVKIRLRQTVRLRADPGSRPGEGLRALLSELVRDCEALQRTRASLDREGEHLLSSSSFELRVDLVDLRLGESGGGCGGGLQHFLRPVGQLTSQSLHCLPTWSTINDIDRTHKLDR